MKIGPKTKLLLKKNNFKQCHKEGCRVPGIHYVSEDAELFISERMKNVTWDIYLSLRHFSSKESSFFFGIDKTFVCTKEHLLSTVKKAMNTLKVLKKYLSLTLKELG